MSTTILLDNGIRANSTCMEWVREPIQIPGVSGDITGLRRRAPVQPAQRQKEIDAIYTVGRLIREGEIQAYDSPELLIELLRGRFASLAPPSAFSGCEVKRAPSPIERSKFYAGDFGKYVRKGGKKDGKDGDNKLSQIAFCEFLCGIEAEKVESFLSQLPSGHLTDFEIENFRSLGWFQELAKRLRSRENLPDAYHIWTAKRSGIDVFLTLDKKLSNQIEAIRRQKSPFVIDVQVLSPLELLRSEGVEKADAIPYHFNRFYNMFEVPR